MTLTQIGLALALYALGIGLWVWRRESRFRRRLAASREPAARQALDRPDRMISIGPELRLSRSAAVTVPAHAPWRRSRAADAEGELWQRRSMDSARRAAWPSTSGARQNEVTKKGDTHD